MIKMTQDIIIIDTPNLNHQIINNLVIQIY